VGGIGQLHADRDACKGSTDTPRGATPGTTETPEPPSFSEESMSVQVTYSLSDQATYDREISSLKEADNQLNADHLIILTKSEGERKIKLGEKDVVVQPAWKWFITPYGGLTL
jgi:hypothetical protein